MTPWINLNREGLHPLPHERAMVEHRNAPKQMAYVLRNLFGGRQLPVLVLVRGEITGFREYRQYFFNNEAS
jgi:hypothetical protein